MKTPTYNPTNNPSTNIHGNQQIISDINTQRIELEKDAHIKHPKRKVKHPTV